MKVYVIITAPVQHERELCELTLKTIRIGFPNATLMIVGNQGYMPHRREIDALEAMVSRDNGSHPQVLQNILVENTRNDEPLVLVDGDVIFHKQMEDFNLHSILTGDLIPSFKSPWSDSFTFERLHTSLLYVRSGSELVEELSYGGPRAAYEKWTKDYFNTCPIFPCLTYYKGKPLYHETMSLAYHRIGGTEFGAYELDCFDHVNSVSFARIMTKLLPPGKKIPFLELHKTVLDNINQLHKLKGIGQTAKGFYEDNRISLYDYLHSSPTQ